MKIQALLEKHYPQVMRIHSEGIATGQATFEKSPPDWNYWNQNHLSLCRFVAIEKNKIIGWAALTPISGRCVYAGVAEVSVYVSAAKRGKGIGKLLLQSLINESEKNNIWTLQAGIFAENSVSIKIHEQTGFRKVGVREKLGKMNEIWRDVFLLERRSKLAGIN